MIVLCMHKQSSVSEHSQRWGGYNLTRDLLVKYLLLQFTVSDPLMIGGTMVRFSVALCCL